MAQQQASGKPRKVFTEQQLARYKNLFNLFDINKDGVIEAKELAAASKVLGYRLEKSQLLNIVKYFDLDANGTLNFDEFVQAMPGNYQLIPEEEHKRAEFRMKFQEYDTDGDGYITRDEAFRVLSDELGFSEDKTRILIVQFDINNDGRLSYEEFVGFYTNVKLKKQNIQDAFRQFDRDGKGYASVEDATRILRNFGFSDEEVAALIKAHDTNQDGKLQYEEFVHFWSV